MEIDWPPMDGGPSCGHATAVPTTARMVCEVAHGALWEDGQGEPVLSGVGGRCHPPHLPPLGARRRRLRKIKNLLGPPPEHGRIQFHRLNIKNDARLEGLIKMSDLRQDQASPRAPAGARPDPVPPTQHQERLPCWIWLSIALKTTSGLFISPLARCMGMLLGAFPQRITLCYRETYS
ncbi:uncharacterized protein LOC109704100 isoform X5 [Ananas comosus]|uniref:Uncharacterized protein LOC109704100 isoform X5 n=1 Tax=Ananas comosus TaxID=4615 RepID=A0A6P5EFJ0_ANACO|nr:uncharacterized protein LOC109704100 isoform X5 [Ananas comosus]